MAALQDEISRRRTFAIISHPDAGKTTLTEKFQMCIRDRGGATAGCFPFCFRCDMIYPRW